MGGWFLPAAQAAASFTAPIIGSKMSAKAAKKLATHQNMLNTEFQNIQNEYNSPAAQMKRFKEAGLNPALVYGQGSSGNQPSAQQAASQELPAWAVVLSQSVNNLQSTLMQQTQRQALEAGIKKTEAQTTTEGIKQQVLSANPNLNASYVSSLLDKMRAEADLKMGERKYWLADKVSTVDSQGNTDYRRYTEMSRMIDLKVNMLQREFDLKSTDSNIKNEILASKRFENAILQVQKEFMTDFKLTPETWTQFLKLLITKLF